MRNLAIVLVLVLGSVTACDKDKPKGSTGGGKSGGGTASAKVDKAKLGAECKMAFDCGDLSFDADCSFECVKPGGDDSKPGYCQLRNIVGTAGTKGCYGNRRGAESSGTSPSEKVTTLNYCDIDAGVYCNTGTQTCDAVKAVGAACESNDECGKDGACQNKLCVAAGAAGAAPVEGRCASTAYRKGEQCIARAPEGGACEESDQCLTFNCVYGASKACGPAKRMACTM
jgi:hypothetical protein